MQYIILLRGINIGGRRIKMAELITCFEKTGYKEVATVLQTGNVILESEQNAEELKKATEKLLENTFHYPVKVIVMIPKYVQSVIQNYPFSDFGPEFHRYALFTGQENIQLLMKQYQKILDPRMEAIEAGDNVLYWRVLKGHTLDSTFGKNMDKNAKNYFMTNRNLNTLEKILKKCQI